MAIKSDGWEGAILDYGFPFVNAETTAGEVGSSGAYESEFVQILPTYRIGNGPFVSVYLRASEPDDIFVLAIVVGQAPSSRLSQSQMDSIEPACVMLFSPAAEISISDFFSGDYEVSLEATTEPAACSFIPVDPHGRPFVGQLGTISLRIDSTPKAIACDEYCAPNVTSEIPATATLQFFDTAQKQTADGGLRTTYPVLLSGQVPPDTKFGPWFPNGDVNGRLGCEFAVGRIAEPIVMRKVANQLTWASDPINVGGCRQNSYMLSISGCRAELFYATNGVRLGSVAAHTALSWKRIEYRDDLQEFEDDFLGKPIKFSIGEVTFGGEYEPEEQSVCALPSGEVIPAFAYAEGCDGSECPPSEITVTFNVDRLVLKRNGSVTDPGYFVRSPALMSVVATRAVENMSKSFSLPLVSASRCDQGQYKNHGSSFSRFASYYDATFETFDNSLPCDEGQCLSWTYQPDFPLPCVCSNNRRFVARVTASVGGIALPDQENGRFIFWDNPTGLYDIVPPQNAAADASCGCDGRSVVVGFAFTTHPSPPPTNFGRGLLRVAFPECLSLCNGQESAEIEFLYPNSVDINGLGLSADLPGYWNGYENINIMAERAVAPRPLNGIWGYDVFIAPGPMQYAYHYQWRVRVKVSL
jgi:hypothetical protein